MAEKDDKSLDLKEFKERVYKYIGILESLDEERINRIINSDSRGCFGFLTTPFFITISSQGIRMARKKYKLKELTAQADEFLAQDENKDLICANLDASVNLPIDAAYKLTPVLYDLAKKDEERLPLDSILFAIICDKIIEKGVVDYCGAKPKKGKKAADKKPDPDSK